MPKPNSIYSYNLGKANGVGSSGNVYSFTNRQNGGQGPSAYFPNRDIITTNITPTPVITQLTEYVGEYNGEYYVALLFKELSYTNGIQNIIDLFSNQFPKTKLFIIKYIVDNNVTNVESILTEFTSLYPNSNRIIVCEFTSIINRSAAFVNSRNLNILTICVSSTALTTQKLKNALTYSYYLSKQVSCCFPIMEDYGIKNIVILFEKTSSNIGFMESWIDTLYTQNQMLKNLPIITYIFTATDTTILDIPEHSFVLLMVETISINKNIERIKASFINNTTSFIFMSNLNYDITDIFENIPAMVAILVPSVYTKTTDIVYQSIDKNIQSPFSGIYMLYDILYTLNYCADNKIFITKKTYLNANPFTSIPPAWSNGHSLIGDYNNFLYGNYDFIFTKDCIIDNDRVLYDINNDNATLSRLQNSRSIFKSIGIFPNLPTPLSYLNRDYIKIYEDGVLKYVKFDINNTIASDGTYINASQSSECDFFVSFNRTNYFITSIKKIFNNKKLEYPDVNLTMSKSVVTKYMQPNNIESNNQALIEINEQLDRDNAQLIQATNNIFTLEEQLAKLTNELKAKISAANDEKLKAINSISKNEELLASIQEI